MCHIMYDNTSFKSQKMKFCCGVVRMCGHIKDCYLCFFIDFMLAALNC